MHSHSPHTIQIINTLTSSNHNCSFTPYITFINKRSVFFNHVWLNVLKAELEGELCQEQTRWQSPIVTDTCTTSLFLPSTAAGRHLDTIPRSGNFKLDCNKGKLGFFTGVPLKTLIKFNFATVEAEGALCTLRSSSVLGYFGVKA